MSLKLNKSKRNLVTREQEIYTIILALQKLESEIVTQPVFVLTDQKIES